eukprot:4887230-Prymnesium_polylepis.1
MARAHAHAHAHAHAQHAHVHVHVHVHVHAHACPCPCPCPMCMCMYHSHMSHAQSCPLACRAAGVAPPGGVQVRRAAPLDGPRARGHRAAQCRLLPAARAHHATGASHASHAPPPPPHTRDAPHASPPRDSRVTPRVTPRDHPCDRCTSSSRGRCAPRDHAT